MRQPSVIRRRSFLSRIGAGLAALTAPGAVFGAVRKRNPRVRNTDEVIDLITQHNELLAEGPPRVYVRTGIPQATWRKLHEGAPPHHVGPRRRS
jgi:hypothetical protein